MFIDSHAHLEMEEFDGEREIVLKRALEAGLTHIVTVGTDLQSSGKALDLSEKNSFVFATVGFHPHNAKDADSASMNALALLAKNTRVVAWGEIGLDLFWRHSPPQTQLEVFEQQMDMANHLGLPVIVHSREANDEVLRVLKKREGSGKGVIHCFSGNYDMAMAFIDMGYLISIPGTVTYKNASVTQDVARKAPLERLLVETDAPFLAPIPFRGKRNEPAYVVHTVSKIAELRDMDVQAVARATSENAKRIFHIPDGLPDHK
jgi:TatD DNase family protein